MARDRVAEISQLIGPPLSGLRGDLPTSFVPVGSAVRCENIDLGDSAIKISCGYSLLGVSNLASNVLGLCQFRTYDKTLHSVAVTGDDICYLTPDTLTWTSLLGVEATWESSFDNSPEFAFFADVIIMCNGSSVMQFWDGETASCGDVANSDSFAPMDIEVFKDRLLLFGGEENGNSVPQRIRWTDIGTYDDFTSGYAGFSDQIETAGYIQAARKMGEYIVVYKNDSILLGTYVGGTAIFAFDTRVLGYGLVAKKAVVDLGSKHWYLGEDNIYEFNGGREPVPVGDFVKDKIRFARAEYLYRSIALRYKDKVIFVIPTNSEYPDLALVYNKSRGTWSTETWSAVSSSFYVEEDVITIGELVGNIEDISGVIGDLGNTSSINQLMLGDSQGNIFKMSETIGTFNTAPINSVWESGDLLYVVDNRICYNRYRGFDIEAKGESLMLEYSADEGATWVTIASLTLTSSYAWYRGDFDFTGDRIRVRFSNIDGSSFYVRGLRWRFLGDVMTL